MKASVAASVAFLAVGAFADSSSYIPTGISSGCTSFLTSLNTDSSLQSCTNALLGATSAVSGSNATSTDVSSTLSSLCNNNVCDNTVIRGLLTSFGTSCSDELSGSKANSDVQALYDTLYFMMPFRAATCAKDTTTGNYCASSLGNTTPASKKKRDDSDPTIDPSSIQSSGVAFQYMLPSSSSSQLCTACGASVMESYVVWESRTPYAFGLAQSPLLGSQSALWDAFNTKCGPSFLNTITSDSGAAPLAAIANGASASAGKPLAAFTVAFTGLVAAMLM